MSLSATLFGRDSFIHRATNVMGLGIPGWLDKQFGVPDAQGPALGEMAQQTSQEGSPRPIVWGVVRPIAGNLIAVQDPPKIRKVKQKQEGGKGGSKSKTVYVDAAFRTYAIRICEGPITGIRRVWRNNKLVYDNRVGSTWGAKNNATFLAKAKFYLGGWNQMPAPELQAVFGMGNVPAHRGTCYMTMNDEDLTEMGGAVPQYIFEVERAEGYYLTSKPYSVESLDGLESSIKSVQVPQKTTENLDSLGVTSVFGILRDPTIHLEIETESLLSSGPINIYGTLQDMTPGQKKYTVPSEGILTNISNVQGVLKVTIISYNNWPVENLDSKGIISVYGSLS